MQTYRDSTTCCRRNNVSSLFTPNVHDVRSVGGWTGSCWHVSLLFSSSRALLWAGCTLIIGSTLSLSWGDRSCRRLVIIVKKRLQWRGWVSYSKGCMWVVLLSTIFVLLLPCCCCCCCFIFLPLFTLGVFFVPKGLGRWATWGLSSQNNIIMDIIGTFPTEHDARWSTQKHFPKKKYGVDGQVKHFVLAKPYLSEFANE